MPNNCRPQRCIPLEDSTGTLCSGHRNHCETPTIEALTTASLQRVCDTHKASGSCSASRHRLWHYIISAPSSGPPSLFILLFPPPSKLCLISLLVTIFLTRLFIFFPRYSQVYNSFTMSNSLEQLKASGTVSSSPTNYPAIVLLPLVATTTVSWPNRRERVALAMTPLWCRGKRNELLLFRHRLRCFVPFLAIPRLPASPIIDLQIR